MGQNFFSFKDYEQKIGKSRGAQTCLKVENRALAIPSTMKANPEMNLDSKSLSHSSKKNQSSQVCSQSNQTVKQAFGIKSKT